MISSLSELEPAPGKPSITPDAAILGSKGMADVLDQERLEPSACLDTGRPRGPILLALTIWLILLLGAGYAQTFVGVLLEVNGNTWRFRTHQQTVGSFLREAGLDLRAEDQVVPSKMTELDGSVSVAVRKALPVLVEADGLFIEHYTHGQTAGEVLLELGLRPKPQDAVTLAGQSVDLETSLPAYQWSPQRWPFLRELMPPAVDAASPSWLRLKLQRAIHLSINDNGAEVATYSVANTVGEALLAEGITLYLGDRVQPMLGSLLTTGMHVQIVRAKPVSIHVDGRVIHTRVQAENVAQLLSEAGVYLVGRDYTLPHLTSEVLPDLSVRVVRVIEVWMVESEDMAFDTMWQADGTLELDKQRVERPGSPGVRTRRVRLVYEDGQEMQRTVVDEWIARQPTTRLMSYGTKIVVRHMETPEGPISYWRKVRMLATSYNAPTAGKPLDHPQYGITRLGWRARKGVVAVDPRVVALGTRVYVPGYGMGTAADTGSAILGRHIDLCYDDDNLVLWRSWVDVYLLEPVAPAEAMNWVLPGYPLERR